MHNWKNRVLAAVLALCMIAGFLTPAIPARAAEQLVNVAPLGTATTGDGEANGNVIGNVIDENEATNWQTQGVWPSTAVVQLDYGRSISEVVVKLGGDDNASRTVTVTVEYAQNGVTSDLIAIGTKTVTLTGGKEARFTLDQAVSATHFYVTLSNPTQDGAAYTTMWPCVSEIEIYEKQNVQLSAYNNIAAQAEITATGNNEHATEGSANLVDGSTSTLYKFYNAAMSTEQSITLTFEQARSMDAVAIAFENVGASDSIDFAFTYSILARNGDGDYDTIVANATANRTDNSSQQYAFLERTYSEIKIVMHSCTTYSGSTAGWPAIAEFEVYGSELVVEDGCISNGKSVHASSGQSLAKNITDGSKNSVWRGSYYPGYVDIDLGENYNLEAVEVYTPENGYSQYSIYTSLNGRDFTKLAEKTSTDSATLADGEHYDATGVEARIVRVYLEYNSAETAAVINEVRVLGTASGSPIQTLPAINVVKFDESAYKDTTVTAEDTYDEVYGIIQRRLGEAYKSWFTLELAPSANGYDYFELSTQDGKVLVRGNDGVSLATGINHYLKYYCNVNISQVGDQVTMPASAPAIEGTVHKETKAEVRYSYNYCTLSYSMAFWGETEWRNELDWLALNGVNVVLDATAQEEVWRRFLGKLGYTHQEAKDYIAGPAYYAWAYMANLSGFGGPVHDSWFEERTELARKNQQIMRNLGMQPVLQGYSGMVPTDIASKATGTYALTSSDIIAQGSWCSFQRPAMLRTTSTAFDTYAALFYQCQKEVYGPTSDYYATDPFHEGGNTGGMNASDISREVLTSMLAADEDAVWIIQAWQGNPTTALLNGLDQVTNGAQHALVLDLYAEKTPHNQETGSSYGDTKEFDDTPWLYCMLNNFGGRLGLHGHLDNLAAKIPEAFNNGNHIAGIGITPEASVNNPVLYDFFFETIWQDDATQDLQAIDLDTWLDDYATRRYGAESESANGAWDILKDTVYKASLNNLGQGAPESVVNARPATSISAASTWGNAVVSYDKVLLEDAAELLLEDYDLLAGSKGYQYDLANVLQQVLSNSAQEYHKKMAAAYNAGDLAAFETYSETFLEIIGYMETVTATSEYFLLGRWVEQAKALASNADDFTKDLYEFNAKALVTTWGSYNQAESGGLKDYSNRQWSGLIGDFYKPRWERWITARTNELKGESYESSINWFQWEWEWVRSNKVYTAAATPADLETLGYEILEKFTSANPAADASRDVDPDTMTVYAENFQPDNATEGNPDYVLDGDPGTIWHTVWRDSERDTHYLIFTFEEVTKIDGMRFLQRTGTNGVVTKFDLLVRTAEDGEWTTIVDDGILATDASWQLVGFPAVDALQVKFQVVDAKSGEVGNKFAAAAEVRFTAATQECEHTFVNGICSECGAITPDAVATVRVSGTVVGAYTTFADAITAAIAIENSTVVVEQDCNTGFPSPEIESGTFTIDLNGKTLGAKSNYLLRVYGGNVTIIDGVGGGKTTERLSIQGGTLTIRGGTHESVSAVEYRSNPSTLIITGGEFGLISITLGSIAQLSGGTYEEVRIHDGVGKPDALLADGYWYYDEEGHFVDTAAVEAESSWYSIFNVTVAPECTHEGNTNTTAVDNGDGTHSITCSVCSVPMATQAHTPNESGLCTACGYQYAASVTLDGATNYYTMTDALAATNGGTGAVLKLLKDITFEDTAPASLVELRTTCTLDLNGMTLNQRILVNDAILTIVDTALEKGTVVNADGSALEYWSGRIIIDSSVDCTGEAEGHEAWAIMLESSEEAGIGTTGNEDIVIPQGCVALDDNWQNELSVLTELTVIHRHADANTDHICDNGCRIPRGDHAAAEGSHDCAYCGEKLTDCADTAPADHKCDICGAELSKCEDKDKDHKCDICGAELSKCEDKNSDHKCDVCGTALSECADEDKNHKCDVCDKVLSECIDENKDYKCDICGAEMEKDEVIRLAGGHRWETALKVADEMKANLDIEKFDAIIIASGNDFADALAGSYLSTVKNAPILLGWGNGGKYEYLDTDNIEYIKANLAEGGTVYILGGEKAVPRLYEDALKGYNVKRLGGANRFETNLLILTEAGVQDGSEILVCTSTNFADSLSASATAKPILLVFNEYGKLYGKQPDFLAGLKNCIFTVIGGESAVSADLAKSIEAYGKVERLAGANRFETSVMVAQKYFKDVDTAVLAYAWNYPDGLCGGSLAYSLKAPLILTMTKYEAQAVAYAKEAGITSGLVLGGDTLISDEAVRAIFAMDAADEIIKK